MSNAANRQGQMPLATLLSFQHPAIRSSFSGSFPENPNPAHFDSTVSGFFSWATSAPALPKKRGAQSLALALLP